MIINAIIKRQLIYKINAIIVPKYALILHLIFFAK